MLVRQRLDAIHKAGRLARFVIDEADKFLDVRLRSYIYILSDDILAWQWGQSFRNSVCVSLSTLSTLRRASHNPGIHSILCYQNYGKISLTFHFWQ